MHYFRCSNHHDEVRWSATDGPYCWLCGAAGRPFAALTVTAIDEFTRDLDELLGPVDG